VLSTSVAALSITDPGPNAWWVENSVNLLQWTCHDPDILAQYTVVVFGPGALVSGLPIISQLNNADCSESIPANSNFPAGSNYSIALTNPLNRTDILAQSSFEVKPFGSVYPTSASPTASATVSETNTGTPSGSTTTGSASPTSSKGAAAGPLGANSAIISGIAFVLGAFMA